MAFSTHNREEHLREQMRIEMVNGTVRMLATRLGEPLEVVTSGITLPRYYVLGDKVVMVEKHRLEPKPDPTLPRRLPFAYSASLAAVHGNGQLVHCLVSTLKFVDRPRIETTITKAPPDYVFSASEVRRYLP